MTLLAPRRIFFATVLCLAFTLRILSLDSYGFSEDEAVKLQAIDAYARGDFSANAEHPMLMKLAVWGSLQVRSFAAAHGGDISLETALRLPNVIAGTATVALVGGVGTLLFSPAVGLIGTALVAFDPNVIALNRLGKEDTFLVLFFFLAVWCYERAKWIGTRDLVRARRWYTCAGAAFGLMLASKYMPHLLGLYALFNVIYLKDARGNSPDRARYYAAMAAAFLAANFAILLPSTWRYCLDYVQGHHLTHHGFYYAGQLYVTDTPISLAGVPATYYLRMIATKVSLPVLGAAAIGIVPLIRRRRERGFVWMRVLLFFQLLGYSLFAAKFQRYGLSMLILVDMLAAVGVATALAWIASREWPAVPRRLAMAAALSIVLGPLRASAAVQPYYSVNQNLIGARLAPPAMVFPEEAYDYGVREAVSAIGLTAAANAHIVSDAPAVVAHYLGRTGRSDLQVVALSRAGVGGVAERWVLVQDGHIYFENLASVQQVRESGPAWREYRLRDQPVLEVYHLAGRHGQRQHAAATGAAAPRLGS